MADSAPRMDSRKAPVGARRDAILRAATRLIARRGVRGLRVEEVAAEAGVSPPLLYYHFGSRQGLVRAALQEAADRAPSAALGEAVPGETGYAALERALVAELSDDDPVRENAVVWGEVAATAVFEPELHSDVAGVTTAWRDGVAAAIERGIADGSIAAAVDPVQQAEILITLVDGLCNRWLAGAMPRERAVDLLRSALVGIAAV